MVPSPHSVSLRREELFPRPALHAPLREQGAQRGGLDRLVENVDAGRARFFAHVSGAVGGNQNRRQIAAVAAAQFADGADAVGTLEVVVNQEAVGLDTAALDRSQ